MCFPTPIGAVPSPLSCHVFISYTVLYVHFTAYSCQSLAIELFKRGVKNGMFLGRARELCPDLVCIPYDFHGYNEVSHQLYDQVSRYELQYREVSHQLCDQDSIQVRTTVVHHIHMYRYSIDLFA